MNTEERVKKATEIFRNGGPTQEFNFYLQRLKQEDPLAYSVVEVYTLAWKHQFPLVVKKGTGLLPKVSGEQWVSWRLFLLIGIAYRGIGELETGESYLHRALEIAELIGDSVDISRTKLEICITGFLRAEYEQTYRDFLVYRKDPRSWKPYMADYYMGTLDIIRGQPAEAIKAFNQFLKIDTEPPNHFGALEMRALALRITGKLPDAMETLLESATGYISYGSAYSAFPIAKALELSRLAGLEPPPRKLIRKALSLARKGSWGEQAAAEEIEALLRDDDSEAAEGLYEAAKNYLRAYQNIEAVFSGLTAAYLAWKADSPVFTKALKLIAPLVPLHPGFRNDPLLGDFMSRVEPILAEGLKPNKDKEGIKAYLVGELRVIVDGRAVELARWHNNIAIKAFIYLLLSPKHRIPVDHLFYLLWPRRSYNPKNKSGLYVAINAIRRHLGRPELLTKKRDFYQLEDTWTDLGELENLLRLADATTDPSQKEEYLARARELAQGDLLPEFPYDKHIEEYREYYKRLRKKLFRNLP